MILARLRPLSSMWKESIYNIEKEIRLWQKVFLAGMALVRESEQTEEEADVRLPELQDRVEQQEGGKL